MIVCLALAFATETRADGKKEALTGLPLCPATSSKWAPADPDKMPEHQICKSQQQTYSYSLNDVKMDAALAWCVANLPGFKKAHGYVNGRAHDTFYNAEGTLAVSITGSQGKEGENTPAYSIDYLKFTPGLGEGAFTSMSQGHLVCP